MLPCQNMRFFRHYLLAVQFFTRIPVTGRLAAWMQWSPTAERASVAHLPGVGALVGLWAAALLLLLAWLLRGNAWMPLVAGMFSTLGTLWLTGGFHEDGLADTADALGGHLDSRRSLEVMKDSRLGSYGVMALHMALLGKAALLAALLAAPAPGWFVWLVQWGILSQTGAATATTVPVDTAEALTATAVPVEALALGLAPILSAAALLWVGHVLSRLLPLVLMHCLPYVGLVAASKTLTMTQQSLGLPAFFVALLWCLPALALLLHGYGLAMLAVALLVLAVVAVAMVRWLHRRLGGMTGDTLGAAQQVGELALLLTFAVVLMQ